MSLYFMVLFGLSGLQSLILGDADDEFLRMNGININKIFKIWTECKCNKWMEWWGNNNNQIFKKYLIQKEVD